MTAHSISSSVGEAIVSGAESVPVVLSVSRPAVVVVVKAFPGVLAGPKEDLLLHKALLDLVKGILKLLKVVPNLPVDLPTVHESNKLRFHPCVEVKFDFGLVVAVHSYVVELRVLLAQAFVVSFNFSASGVPLSGEVKA